MYIVMWNPHALKPQRGDMYIASVTATRKFDSLLKVMYNQTNRQTRSRGL